MAKSTFHSLALLLPELLPEEEEEEPPRPPPRPPPPLELPVPLGAAAPLHAEPDPELVPVPDPVVVPLPDPLLLPLSLSLPLLEPEPELLPDSVLSDPPLLEPELPLSLLSSLDSELDDPLDPLPLDESAGRGEKEQVS